MTNAQMTDAEKIRNRNEKLDLYQRAVDDRNNYCTVLREYVKILKAIVRLYDEGDLHVTGPKDRLVIGAGINLPSHADFVSAAVSCRDAKKAEREYRSAAARAGADLAVLDRIGSSPEP